MVVYDVDISMLLQFIVVYKENNIFWANVFNRDECFKRLENAELLCVESEQAKATEKAHALVHSIFALSCDELTNVALRKKV